MSRQHKMRNKRTATLLKVFDHDEKGLRVGKRHKGPKRTSPKHGKFNRFPYSEPYRSEAMRVQNFSEESKQQRIERQKRDAVYFAELNERERRRLLLACCDPVKFGWPPVAK